MNEQQWQVLDGAGNQMGPYSVQDLQGFFTSGNINYDTLVWTDGMPEWLPAGQIPGLLPEEAVPVVPLAEATPAPQQPSQAGGSNLSPQMAAPTEAPAAGTQRQGTPAWLAISTLVVALASLILAFFPWVTAFKNPDPLKSKEPMVAFTQTGFQSVTAEISVPDEYVEALADRAIKAAGGDEAAKKKMAEELKEKIAQRDSDSRDWGISVLNLIALIGVGLAAVLALIGIVNRMSVLVVSSQILLVTAAALIGIQLGMQFPAIESFVKRSKKAKEAMQAEFAASQKMIQEMSIDSAEDATALNEQTKQMNQVLEAKLYATAIEPSCFAVVILLTASVFLLIITMSAASATPVVTIPGGFQPPPGGASPPTGQQPQQPQQPGSGLKFH